MEMIRLGRLQRIARTIILTAGLMYTVVPIGATGRASPRTTTVVLTPGSPSSISTVDVPNSPEYWTSTTLA